MADLLMGVSAFPQFSSALEVHLVEVSPALRMIQEEKLRCSLPPNGRDLSGSQEGQGSGSQGGQIMRSSLTSRGGSGEGCTVQWHKTLDEVPSEPSFPSFPSLYIAHEFFDALPAHQVGSRGPTP